MLREGGLAKTLWFSVASPAALLSLCQHAAGSAGAGAMLSVRGAGRAHIRRDVQRARRGGRGPAGQTRQQRAGDDCVRPGESVLCVYPHSSSQTMKRYAPASPAHATCEVCMEAT